jgi:hypothetical protein
MRPAAFRLEGGAVLRGELKRRSVVDRRLAAAELALAPPLQLLLGLVAGIEPSRRAQPIGRRVVLGLAVALAGEQIRLDPEPGQILPDCLGERFGRALSVRVVEAQQELAAGPACEKRVQQSRTGVADMQVAGGRRSEADERHDPLCSRSAAVFARPFVHG